MKVSGNYTFNAPVQKVWDVLTDPSVLSGCIPGCSGLEPLGENEYQASLLVGIGPVRGNYNAKVAIRDMVPHDSYRLVVEGNGPSGFASGEATIRLSARGDQTIVAVDSDAQVGGTVARVGQRLMGSVAKMMMDQLFSCLREKAASGFPLSRE